MKLQSSSKKVLDAQQLRFELERGAARDLGRRAVLAVGVLGLEREERALAHALAPNPDACLKRVGALCPDLPLTDSERVLQEFGPPANLLGARRARDLCFRAHRRPPPRPLVLCCAVLRLQPRADRALERPCRREDMRKRVNRRGKAADAGGRER